jgi:hypothetical protein
MHKLAKTSLAAVTVLLGTSFAASASGDDYSGHSDRRGSASEHREYCRTGDKTCKVRDRRGHDSREYRSGDREDGSRSRNRHDYE